MSDLKELHAKNLAEKCKNKTQFGKAVNRHCKIVEELDKSTPNLYMQVCNLYELIIECNYYESGGVIFEPCVITGKVNMYINRNNNLSRFISILHTARKDIVHNMPSVKDSYNKFINIMNSCTKDEFVSHMNLCTWNLATSVQFERLYHAFYIPKKELNSDELPDIE